MQLIHRHKTLIQSIVSLLFFCVLYQEGMAQKRKRVQGGEIDIHKYATKPFHMGFSLVGGYGKFKIARNDDLKFQDSLLAIRAQGYAGFGFGGIANLKLGKYFDLRSLPQLHFHQRNIEYTFIDRSDNIAVETVAFHLPILVKYKSERHNNKRLYVIAGVNLEHDFAAREDRERGPFVQRIALKKQSVAYEFGFGFDFYTYMFKFSPEIKMTNSLSNKISRDAYAYNGSIGHLQTRIFQISLHFE